MSSRKPEPTSEHNCHYRALSVELLYITKMLGTLDTSSLLAVAEMSKLTVHLTEAVTEAQAENLQLKTQISNENNSDNGEHRFF
jgi:hypothetical protein